MNSTVYINLSKITHNLNAVRARVGADTVCMAVIKDEAYGHGAIAIAHHLKDKVEWFCVARLEEGIALRNEGIINPILVFEIPPVGQESSYLEYDLTASICDLSVFSRLKEGTKAQLHFDTGMFRLGMLPEEAPDALIKMNAHKLDYTGIYTHFANSDHPGEERVFEQLESFKGVRSLFPDHLMTHTCNSGAIFYYDDKELIFDAVRPGVCLYGYAPGVEDVEELLPVLSWESKLVQVKKVSKGDKVGYGSKWEALEDGWIGTVPVGYADGIARNLSGLIEVEIAGKIYPQVGTISMDYIMVDLGSDQLEAGDKVTLLRDEELSAKEWAFKVATIPYEITTSISQKIKRVYCLDD